MCWALPIYDVVECLIVAFGDGVEQDCMDLFRNDGYESGLHVMGTWSQGGADMQVQAHQLQVRY